MKNFKKKGQLEEGRKVEEKQGGPTWRRLSKLFLQSQLLDSNTFDVQQPFDTT